MTIIFDGTQGITTPAETANNSVTTPVVKSSANLVFQTNGTTEAMRITSGGKVLVGTNASPSAPGVMQVLNASSAVYTQYNKVTDGGGVVGSEGTGLAFYTYTGNIGSETYTERMRIDSVGRVTMPYQPMASVTRNASGTTTGGTYEMVYDSVQVNIGSHYNSTNGRFTCPVAGTYRVSAFGMGTLIAGNWNFFVSIRKNGNQQGGTAYNYGTSEDYKHASGNWLITCAGGDYISIWGGGNGGYYGEGYAGATFQLIG